ncbi:MAG: helix-turn-helix transcriptional regulator [Lachnospiraceae bacterium]|nr:helix-turn-helix transcriptional regulator [Lachnospiraceae bacterium]
MPKENDLNRLIRQLIRRPDNSFATDNPAHSSRIQKYMMERSENQDAHVSYQEEQILLNQIRTGNLEALQESSAKGSPDDLHRLGRMSDSPLKQLEYACCSFVTLATRAAVEGGLNADTAYSISDVYLQRLAKCQTAGQILSLLEEAKFGFARAVRGARQEKTRISYLEQAKNYIATHLNREFALKDMADEIGISPSYLSRKFKEYESMGIAEYTRRSRIQAARNMLKYSDADISAIAQYLCFHSQSYFGAVFREYTGLSPGKYREREKVTDFSAEK